jgi:hypothetical protein
MAKQHPFARSCEYAGHDGFALQQAVTFATNKMIFLNGGQKWKGHAFMAERPIAKDEILKENGNPGTGMHSGPQTSQKTTEL